MAFVLLILAPLLFLIFFINDYRKKKDKKSTPENYAIPIGLFIVMWYTAYELKIDFLEVIIIFFYGAIIGSLFEHFASKK